MADRHQAQAYPLRLRDELKDQIAAAAFKNGRSLNAEIAARLQRTIEDDQREARSAEVEAGVRDTDVFKRLEAGRVAALHVREQLTARLVSIQANLMQIDFEMRSEVDDQSAAEANALHQRRLEASMEAMRVRAQLDNVIKYLDRPGPAADPGPELDLGR